MYTYKNSLFFYSICIVTHSGSVAIPSAVFSNCRVALNSGVLYLSLCDATLYLGDLCLHRVLIG